MKTRTNQPVTTFDIEDLEVTHELKGFENIVDKDGNKRFIEGVADTKTVSGITYSYSKWSLSGSHIMFVLAGKIDNGTNFGFTNVADFAIPEWIYNKIYPFPSNYVDSKTIGIGSEDYSTSQNLAVFFQKMPSPKIMRLYFSGITTTADRYFRVQFDLLIDNE